MRRIALLLHRYVGLVIAGFLVLAGLTGSLLAWNDELDGLLTPSMFYVRPPASDSKRLDALELRARVAAHYPQADVLYVPLRFAEGRSISYYLQARRGSGSEEVIPLANDQVMLNPYTGQIVGERKWGELGQGTKSIMPFIYRLHQSLALGIVGSYLFGVIALLWTIDCFAGIYLSLPAKTRNTKGKSWLARWWPAWQLRRGVQGYKRHFDLHRAGSLWFWALLLVLAWSSVAFNLSEVYNPVMHRFFNYQPEEELIPPTLSMPGAPHLDWQQARATGRKLMTILAEQHHFQIEREDMLAYDAARLVYRYDVLSSLDIRQRAGSTQVYFDANSGRQLAVWLPTGAASADTIRTWITSLHMGAVLGWPLKLLLSVTGMALATVSVTGVLIWWRKRAGRK